MVAWKHGYIDTMTHPLGQVKTCLRHRPNSLAWTHCLFHPSSRRSHWLFLPGFPWTHYALWRRPRRTQFVFQPRLPWTQFVFQPRPPNKHRLQKLQKTFNHSLRLAPQCIVFSREQWCHVKLMPIELKCLEVSV